MTGDNNELRAQLVFVNGKVSVELGGRISEGATPEEIASLFDKLKAGTLSALETLKAKEN